MDAHGKLGECEKCEAITVTQHLKWPWNHVQFAGQLNHVQDGQFNHVQAGELNVVHACWSAQPCQSWPASTMFKPVNRHKQAVHFYVSSACYL